ncbi:hypothetical protein SKAU_G00411880 [Synaphobranchus kaupii]|uniref:HAT C-terminal dimerisation domain-containing protein n=1 Tax=Synaphobranchus kaupii TaxID=118154 RepID=A0A9Q1IBS8_SYNKA|nr:hypothetical protein SKAU_G00411880 [Synaphobranchus kaupii]
MIKRYIDSGTGDHGIKRMKAMMPFQLVSLKERFVDLEKEALVVVATSLDPRYKAKFWATNEQQCRPKLHVQEAVARMCESHNLDAEQQAEPQATAPKRHCLSIWNSWDELYCTGTVDCATSSIKTEMSTFYSEPLVTHTEDPIHWWKTNQACLPHLVKVPVSTADICAK